MAVRKTATTEPPTSTPRKPARTAKGGQTGPRAQKPATGRQTATATGPASDDAIRAIVAATATDDDLAPTLAKSVQQAKAKPVVTRREARKVGKELATERQAKAKQAATKPAKPARLAKPATRAKPAKPTPPTKVQATDNRKPATTFNGRPVSNPEKVAERVKQLGLKVRATADVDALAVKLRATPDAARAWLDNRNGAAPAKATDKAQKAKTAPAKTADKSTTAAPKPDAKVPMIEVAHEWKGPIPKGMPELKGATLIVRFEARDTGEVWSALWSIRDPDGQHMQDGWKLPLDFRWHPETLDNGRKAKLKDKTKNGLQAWLIAQGLVEEDL